MKVSSYQLKKARQRREAERRQAETTPFVSVENAMLRDPRIARDWWLQRRFEKTT